MKTTKILTNATIFSPKYEKNKDTIVTENGKIQFVGQKRNLPSHWKNHAMTDLRGKTILPAFYDTHVHIWKVGQLKMTLLDLRGVASLEEMQEKIKDFSTKNPYFEWILARGFNEGLWKARKIPQKEDIDKVIADKPVYIIRTCAHIAVCNTKALQIAHISAKTPVPEGGEIRHGADGKPNGIFTETALDLITAHIPPPTKDDYKAFILKGCEELQKVGIISATDPAVHPELYEAYMELAAEQKLPIRVQLMPICIPDGGKRPLPLPEPFENEQISVKWVKFFADGGLSGKTAALRRNYLNSNEKGILRLEEKMFQDLALKAVERGFSIATHAIGDAAIDLVLSVYQKIPKNNRHLHRIEHLGLPHAEHLEIMQKHTIAAAMQSIFIKELGENFIHYIDEAYLAHCYPCRSVLDAGILMSLSSDSPVVADLNPLSGIAAAVNRQTKLGNVIASSQAISAEEAIRAYTETSAKLCGFDQKGRVAKGYDADFLVIPDESLKM
jgi:predicted amidohydrolase YtcJ